MAKRSSRPTSGSDEELVELADRLSDRKLAGEIFALISARRARHVDELHRLVAAMSEQRHRLRELEDERGRLLAEIVDLRERLSDAELQLEARGPRKTPSVQDVSRVLRQAGILARQARR